MSWRGQDLALVDALDAWDFDAADLALRPEHSEELRAIVAALASTFGDCGHLVTSNMYTIIAAAVRQCFAELRMAGG